MLERLNLDQHRRGLVQVFAADHEDWRKWTPLTPAVHNDFLYSWSTIVQKLLRNVQDGKSYHIGSMYVEFDNSGAVVNPTPTITRSAGLSYYNALANPRDYIRCPIIATSEETTDAVNFPENNVAVFIAQTAGAVGVHGRTFSDAANSRVFGGGLVARRDPLDASQDLVLNRFYLSTGLQILKPASAHIGVIWKTVLL